MTSSRDRRRSPRVAIDLPIELRFTLDPAVRGRASNLSREGLFAEVDQLRPPGTLVRLRLDVDGAEPVMAVGVVVRQVEDGRASGGPRGVGILLTSTSEAWERYWDDVSVRIRSGSA
ncbi:MAG TPA: PilZ domain-containing protein [Polyangia bacterium]|nr:PilZ domain-containing protein [Polyangia bacterium]